MSSCFKVGYYVHFKEFLDWDFWNYLFENHAIKDGLDLNLDYLGQLCQDFRKVLILVGIKKKILFHEKNR